MIRAHAGPGRSSKSATVSPRKDDWLAGWCPKIWGMSGLSLSPKLGIRSIPKGDRPRERAYQLGADQLATVELLALLVGSGGTGHSALDTGHAILAAAGGSLRRLFSQTPAELTHIAGVGPARALRLHSVAALGRRWAQEAVDERPLIRSPRDIVTGFAPRMRDLPVEEFHVVVLDTQHAIKRDITVTVDC